MPTVAELNEKLYEYHAEHFHCNYKDVQELFKQNNIGYYGLNVKKYPEIIIYSFF